MSCLTASQIAEITARITKLQTRLLIAESAYDAALTEIEEYRFDSGPGSQRVKYRKLDELQQAINSIESRIDSLTRRLSGKGISSLNLRRKGGLSTFRGF
jgi:site-specific recombinase